MKNQYFGDINDYRKYGLLRVLADEGRNRIAMCWMLTKDDGRADGNRTRYLSEPGRWRSFDPHLFDALRDAVLRNGHRNIGAAEAQNIIPSAIYHTETVTDNLASRTSWFGDFLRAAKNGDLVFFDPDNGIEVKSKSKGHKGSCKYIYWDEVVSSYNGGHSLLIYQHFPRRPREAFTKQMEQAIQIRVMAPTVSIFRTPHVVFLLIPRPEHSERLAPLAQLVWTKWRGQIL